MHKQSPHGDELMTAAELREAVGDDVFHRLSQRSPVITGRGAAPDAPFEYAARLGFVHTGGAEYEATAFYYPTAAENAAKHPCDRNPQPWPGTSDHWQDNWRGNAAGYTLRPYR